MVVTTSERFNPETDFLSLDFDGVIADSIEECLVVGHNAYAKFTRSGTQIRSLDALDERQQKECKRLRSFVRSGEDYVFIQLAMHNGFRIEDQQAYDAFVNRHSNHRAIFLDLFYQQREQFCSTEADLWMGLNPLYRGLKQFFRQYPSNERLFIITTKQINYALKILTGNRVEFKKENCFYASGRLTKLEIIKHLMAKHKISAENFYFIDDQVDTLVKVKGADVQCFLAQWGYTNEAQILRASSENIPVLSLDDFLSHFSNR